ARTRRRRARSDREVPASSPRSHRSSRAQRAAAKGSSMKLSFVVTTLFVIGAGCATTPVPIATQDAGDENPIVFDAALSDAPSCATPQCSSDLHTLYDGCGKILQTCPPDKGCSPEGQGSCVAPCDAAIANKTSVGCEYFT